MKNKNSSREIDYKFKKYITDLEILLKNVAYFKKEKLVDVFGISTIKQVLYLISSIFGI